MADDSTAGKHSLGEALVDVITDSTVSAICSSVKY